MLFDICILGLSAVNLRKASMAVDPPSVGRGEHTTIICSYDLNDDRLDSIGFFHESYEFYRFTPNEHPTRKTFPSIGFNVDVSIAKCIPAEVHLCFYVTFLMLKEISIKNLFRSEIS